MLYLILICLLKKVKLMEKILNKTHKNLIYLMACSLDPCPPDLKRLEDPDTRLLYRYSHIHSIASMVGCALLKSDGLHDLFSDEEIKYWEMSVNSAVKKRIQFDAERRTILSYMEKNGIWYSPLKGILIQDMYPGFEMREMADNDILYDAGKRALLMEYMQKRGYKIEFTGVTNHDEYIRPPVFNFEFHSQLFRGIFSEIFTEYYDRINEKLLTDEGSPFSRHMTIEDFYIYFTAHAYKHYKQGGTGLRTLADFYVINKKYKGSFDWNYIRGELRKLGISGFESVNRRLAKKLFSDPAEVFQNISDLTEKEMRILIYTANAGTYGRQEDEIKNRMKSGKMPYVLSRLFPNDAYYREAHPFIYKYPILKIFFLPYRWITRLASNKKNIIQEIKVLLK